MALLCREDATNGDADGAYETRFAAVKLPVQALTRWLPAEMPRPTTATLAQMSRAASARDALPLESLQRPALWKALYVCATRALRATVGDFAFYARVRFTADPMTGLLASIAPVGGDECDTPTARPRGALLRAAARARLDDVAVRAHSSPAGDTSLACARLWALRAGCLCGPAAVDVEIVTKHHTRFSRHFPDVTRPATKKCGALTDLFAIREYRLTVDGKPVRARALVPLAFDHLIADADAFSPIALMLLYRQWRETLFSDPAFTAPVFAYLGPALYPHGEDHGPYFHMLGFPGFQVLPVAGAANARAVPDAVNTYVLTDGVWPALGMYAYHALEGERSLGDAEIAEEQRRLERVEATARVTPVGRAWPAGRVSTLLDEPTHLTGKWLAKLDFCAFFPTLYACLRPAHRRVCAALRVRAEAWTQAAVADPAKSGPGCGEAASVKPSLLTFVGGLRHVNPRTYDAIIGLTNIISEAVERAANAQGFAICTYVKDGFWGIFGSGVGTAATARCSLTPDAVVRAAEALRTACNEAALTLLASLELRPPRDAPLRLRLEGVYDRAFAWSAHRYWLYNSIEERMDFLGFPCRTAFAREAKTLCGNLLRVASDPTATPAALGERATAACAALVERAFGERWNPEFWSAPKPIADWKALPAAVYEHGDDALDRDYCPRQHVVVAGHDERFSLPWRLFPAPALPYKIDCATYVQQAVQVITATVNDAIVARFGPDALDSPFSFDTRFDFLF